MTVENVAAWMTIATSIGALSLLVWLGKLLWDYFRWKQFEGSIDHWAKQTFIMPSDLSEDEWKSFCAIELGKALFTPWEILKLLDLAVIMAKGRASRAVGGDVSKGRKKENP